MDRRAFDRGVDPVALMDRAAAITAGAHARAMEVARPGGHEYEVEAALLGAAPRLEALDRKALDGDQLAHDRVRVEAAAEAGECDAGVRNHGVSGAVGPARDPLSAGASTA